MTPTDAPRGGFSTWLAARPQNAAALLGVLALLWLLAAAGCGYKYYALDPDKQPAAEEKKADDAFPGEEKPSEAKKPVPGRANYLAAGLLCAIGLIGTGAAALFALVLPPTLSPDRAAARGRLLLLAAGAVSGLVLIVGGLWFLTGQFEVLKAWIDGKPGKEQWKPLASLLAIVVGAIGTFAAAQPARADERDSQTARRLVYATNFGVTALLLLIALGAVNVFAGAKLPQKLDTTSSGLFTLHPSTEEYVRGLTQKVTVYAFTEEGDPTGDAVRNMLEAAREANPTYFTTRVFGQSISSEELQRLRTKFPSLNLRATPVLITAGDDEARTTTIRQDDLNKRAGNGMSFQGESALVRELMFLTENQKKPVVYFTQGNGELALEPPPTEAADPERSATLLKAYLEKANFTVRPLPLGKKAPKVPADAAAVIVADPQTPVTPEFADGLRAYLNEKSPEGKATGRLILLSGPVPTAANDKVQATGLEAVLAEFNIGLAPHFVYNQPDSQIPDPNVLEVARAGQAAGNPVARSIPARTILVGPARSLGMIRPGNPAYQVTPLIVTVGGESRVTWVEKTKPADAMKSLLEMAKSEALQDEKQISINQRVLAAAVSEGGSGRLLVVGNGRMAADAISQRLRDANPTHALVSAGLDWLRDRPTVEVVNKPYGLYVPPPSLDPTRVLFLPLGLMTLFILALATGVWALRRR